jgi:Fe-S cluster biosynthesis and repair protein YggX
MPSITCSRCQLTRDQQAFQPFPSEIGRRVFREICAVCWAEWLKLQQQLINHYALNLRDPKAREFLVQQMEQFLFTSAPRT